MVQSRRQSTQAIERVRWFYATDVPLSKPAYFNYKPTEKASKYLPFSLSDSTRLEEAYLKMNKTNPDPSMLVQVKEDGLFEVDIAKRALKPIYWEGPVYAVKRGTWFYSNNSPCPEDVSEEIEKIYKSLGGTHDTTDCKEHEHDENKAYDLETMSSSKVQFSKFLNTAWLTTDDGRALEKLKSLGGTKITRGYTMDEDDLTEDDSMFSSVGTKIENMMDPSNREVNTEKSMEAQIKFDYNKGKDVQTSREIDHLVLCVHGIGQKLSQRIESVNFVHDINVFRKLLGGVFEKRDELQRLADPSSLLKSDKNSDNGNDKLNHRVQVLPVLWRHNIHFNMTREELTDSKKVTLEDITVDGVNALRSIVGDVILDVLLYHQPHYKQQILKAVVDQLNTIVREFKKRNERVPKISLVGHSLGSAICHDILSMEGQDENQLEFPVEKYFAMGSPLGLFKILENESITRSKMGSIYNIFHPCDPVAYRIEPLIDLRAAKLPPALVPYVQGGLKTQLEELGQLTSKISASANSLWSNMTATWMRADSTGTGGTADGELSKDKPVTKISDYQKNLIEKELKRVNPTGRVDYVLQEGVLDISLIAAIASHMSYFENEDVASFVLKSLYS